MNQNITNRLSNCFAKVYCPIALFLLLGTSTNLNGQTNSSPNGTSQNADGRTATTEIMPNVIGAELNHTPAVIAQKAKEDANKTTEKKYYDNGYFRYELIGNEVRDAELYRIEKEKLLNNHPDLYKKWLNGEPAPVGIKKDNQLNKGSAKQ